MEAIWILTNLAYGKEDDIEKIFDPQLDLLSCLNVILNSNDKPMIEQALWLIGNITGENVKFRNVILKQTHIIQCLVRMIEGVKIGRTLLKTVCWVNSNLNRFKNLDKD